MVPASLLDTIRKSRPELSQGEQSDQRDFTGERFLPGYVDGSSELYHVHRYSFALSFIVGKTVLDVACGEGYGSHLMAHAAKNVIGLDSDQETIDRARTRYRRGNLSFREGNACSLPIDDHSVDVVVSFETLEHLPEQDAYWSEIKRVLTPEGLLIASSPNRDIYNSQRPEKNKFHHHELTQWEFAGELALRFEQHALYSQSVVFGSLIEPVSGSETGQTLISVDPNTGVIDWKTKEHVQAPYLVALASDALFFLAERSLFTGRYPANAMASLTGGIAERDLLIRSLKDKLRTSTQEQLAVEQQKIALVENERLRETLGEQDKTIQALKSLLAELLDRNASTSMNQRGHVEMNS